MDANLQFIEKNAASSLELLGRGSASTFNSWGKKVWDLAELFFKGAGVEQFPQILHVPGGHHCCMHKQFTPDPV